VTDLEDTLLINGTDLQSLVDVTDFSGLRAPGTRRGRNVTYPNLRGDTYVPKVYAAYAFDVPVALASTDPDQVTLLERRADFNTLLDAVVAELDTGLLVLTRRLAYPTGYVDLTAEGEYSAGLAVQMANPTAGTTVLQFVNLTGCWLDESDGEHL
jgi:hypothetical protein